MKIYLFFVVYLQKNIYFLYSGAFQVSPFLNINQDLLNLEKNYRTIFRNKIMFKLFNVHSIINYGIIINL